MLSVGFGFIHRSSRWRWSDSCVLLQGAFKELHSPFFVGTSQTAHTGGNPARPREVRQLLALPVGVAFSCPLCRQSCLVNSKEVAWGLYDEHTVRSRCRKPSSQNVFVYISLRWCTRVCWNRVVSTFYFCRVTKVSKKWIAWGVLKVLWVEKLNSAKDDTVEASALDLYSRYTRHGGKTVWDWGRV